MIELEYFRSCCSSAALSERPVYTMTGGNAYASPLPQFFQEIKARCVGQREVGDDAIERVFLERTERFTHAADRDDLDVVTFEQEREALALDCVVFDDQQATQVFGEARLQLLKRLNQAFRV